MPASRVRYAIADLLGEIISLLGRDARPKIELRMDRQSFEKVHFELKPHGAPATTKPATAERGEHFIFNGTLIECLPEARDAAASG